MPTFTKLRRKNMPVHFPEKKKEKVDPDVILKRLKEWHGDYPYVIIKINDAIGDYKFPLNIHKVYEPERLT